MAHSGNPKNQPSLSRELMQWKKHVFCDSSVLFSEHLEQDSADERRPMVSMLEQVFAFFSQLEHTTIDRMLSMGLTKAKSTHGYTNFQKRYF